MSNLDYPISILVSEGGKISAAISRTGQNKNERALKLAEITRAISILRTEQMKDEEKEKEKAIPYVKKL